MLSGFAFLEEQGFAVLGLVIFAVSAGASLAVSRSYERMYFSDLWYRVAQPSRVFTITRAAMPLAYKHVCFVDPDHRNLVVPHYVVFALTRLAVPLAYKRML